MPRGLPPTLFSSGSVTGANMATAAGDFFSDFHEQVIKPFRQFLPELHFASFAEYRFVIIQAYMDVKRACISIGYLLFLTLRPICIFILFFLRLALFKAHQYTLKLMKFQASLDAFTIWMEICALLAIGLLYILRRYLRSKRYIPRLQAFVRRKQQAVLNRYMVAIDRIAQTSILLANILPHAVYIAAVTALQITWWGRSIIRLLSVKMPTLQIMMIWIPSIQTILLIAQCKYWYYNNKSHAKQQNDQKAPSNDETNAARRRKESVSTSPQLSTDTSQLLLAESLRPQLQELLMYWIVYSFFTAASSFATYMPLVSSLIFPQHDGSSANFSNINEASAFQQSTNPLLARITFAFSIISSWWNQRGLFLRDLQFLFLLWAWIFSSLAKANDTARKEKKRGGTVVSAVRKFDKSSSAAPSWYMTSPLRFFYKRLSSTFYNRFTSLDQHGAIVSALYNNLDSFLQLAVLVKLIRPTTKNAVVRVVTQGSHYIPSLVTLAMPGYFTSLGTIYATYIVASGYSVTLLKSPSSVLLSSLSSKKETELSEIDTAIHHLQYYVILFLGVNTILKSLFQRFVLSTPLFRFILYWIPFQSHVCLLFILWLQVPLLDGASLIYHSVEQELVLFGILKVEFTYIDGIDTASSRHHGKGPLIIRMSQKLLRLLPTSEDANSRGATSVSVTSEIDEPKQNEANENLAKLAGPSPNSATSNSCQK